MTSDFDRQNPYASPREAATHVERVMTREEALLQLRKPAIGLLVFAIGSMLCGIGTAAVAVVEGLPPEANTPEGFVFMEAMMLLVFVLLPAAILIGALHVARGKPAGWVWLAIAAGLIPIGSPCACLGVPFAFWLLHLMLRKDIRAALATSESSLAASGPVVE